MSFYIPPTFAAPVATWPLVYVPTTSVMVAPAVAPVVQPVVQFLPPVYPVQQAYTGPFMGPFALQYYNQKIVPRK